MQGVGGGVPGATLTDDNAAGADSDKQDAQVILWKFLRNHH